VKISGQSLALVFLMARPSTAEDQPLWQMLPVPGGASALARAAGLEPHLEAWRVLYEASRRLYPTYGDPADAARLRASVRAELRASAPRVARGLELPSLGRLEALPERMTAPDADAVPLPLPPLLWNKAVLRRPVRDDRLVEAILDDRDAALVYRGLFQLDDPTLRFFMGHPDLVAWIRQNQADSFSVFAGSLHVHDGRALVPGGTESEPLWSDLVGE
jgi:hypothetical protein